MSIEIEKKYRLTSDDRERVLKRLQEIDAPLESEVFEENTLYAGGIIDSANCILRLRRVGDLATLTYKERYQSTSAIKRQREDETQVEDAEAMATILTALGFRPSLVYEKRRATWRVANTEVVVDELPFGLFMEIEGEENAIVDAETILELGEVDAEPATYPGLATKHGKKIGDVIESRF